MQWPQEPFPAHPHPSQAMLPAPASSAAVSVLPPSPRADAGVGMGGMSGMSGMGGMMGEHPHRVADLDVTVLNFAQWISDLKMRSSSSQNTILAEMGVIRNGITSNNTELMEFRRHTATVQQQMQSQITDLRDKLMDAYNEIANMVKAQTQFQQEMRSEYQGLQEQLQLKTIQLETLKKAYSQTHQQLQTQITNLQNELSESQSRLDEYRRQSDRANEDGMQKLCELQVSSEMQRQEWQKFRNTYEETSANVHSTQKDIQQDLGGLLNDFREWKAVIESNHEALHRSVVGLDARQQPQHQTSYRKEDGHVPHTDNTDKDSSRGLAANDSIEVLGGTVAQRTTKGGGFGVHPSVVAPLPSPANVASESPRGPTPTPTGEQGYSKGVPTPPAAVPTAFNGVQHQHHQQHQHGPHAPPGALLPTQNRATLHQHQQVAGRQFTYGPYAGPFFR
ncbi:unnamed protein product [Vitrella brassicaformis CCMP3155]|uniref:Uncharacterized protein n=2 Tax=Vitrella brassicaformis TaxID=1169539 RepID=A0A0G4FA61_VITBC|nr:unnamed protein product [Vitrella brassicaformis CCMP3155]|eukprot:CEM09856.1 unnamed protein product [Vitrella brassicaformis CCMP3155]